MTDNSYLWTKSIINNEQLNNFNLLIVKYISQLKFEWFIRLSIHRCNIPLLAFSKSLKQIKLNLFFYFFIIGLKSATHCQPFDNILFSRYDLIKVSFLLIFLLWYWDVLFYSLLLSLVLSFKFFYRVNRLPSDFF